MYKNINMFLASLYSVACCCGPVPFVCKVIKSWSLLPSPGGSDFSVERLLRRYRRCRTEAENRGHPARILHICGEQDRLNIREGHRQHSGYSSSILLIYQDKSSLIMYLNSLTQSLFFRLEKRRRYSTSTIPSVRINTYLGLSRTHMRDECYLFPIIWA